MPFNVGDPSLCDLSEDELQQELVDRRRAVEAVETFVGARDELVEYLKPLRGWCFNVGRWNKSESPFAKRSEDIGLLLLAINRLIDPQGRWIPVAPPVEVSDVA